MQSKRILYKVLGVVAGAVFVVAGIKERSHHSHLHAIGKIAVVDPIEGYNEMKSRSSKTYSAEFHFTTEKGDQVVAKHTFPEELLEDFAAQKPVQILYDPADPTDFIFERDRPSWLLVLGGLALIVATLVLI